MTFVPGHKLSTGRPKGVPNKRTQEVVAILEKHKFNPIEAMIEIQKIALVRFTEEMQKQDSGIISPMESQAVKYLKIAADNAYDLASYAYPKLKAIEHHGNNPLEGMDAQQKLQAMREAVKVFEAQSRMPTAAEVVDADDQPGTP